MSRELYKNQIIEFFKCFTEGNTINAMDYLDDNLVWQAMGRAGELPISGKRNKIETAELIKAVKGMMPEGLAFKFTGWTIDGNRVAAEIESYGELSNGKIYNNFYHFLFEFEGQKIVLIKEYLDTLHVSEIFI